MNNTLTRICIASALVLLVFAGTYWVQAGMKIDQVAMPTQDYNEMPRSFQDGTWLGEDREIDPRVAGVLHADFTLDRMYRHQWGHLVSLHLAVFKDPDEGILHNPFNCYRGNGFQFVGESRVMLEAPGKPTIPVSLSTWERDGKKVLVMYWYRVGDHSPFKRSDMFKIRWAMRGQETWPALVKVLLECSASDPEEAQKRLMEIAREVYGWIEYPGSQSTEEVTEQPTEEVTEQPAEEVAEQPAE